MKKSDEKRMNEEPVLTIETPQHQSYSNNSIPDELVVESSDHPPGAPRSAMQRWFGPFLVTAETLVVVLILFFVLRVTLLAAFADLNDLSFEQLWRLFFVGLRFDLLVALIVLLPQITFITAHNNKSMGHRGSKLSLLLGVFGTIGFASFYCLAEILFFVDSKARLNWGELDSPVNVDAGFARVWHTYPVVPLTLLTGAIAIGLFLFMRKHANERLQLPLSWPRRTAAFCVAVSLIIALGLTTDMESMHVTDNHVANQCSGNGVFTMFHGAWQRCSHDQNEKKQTTIAPETESRMQ